MAIASAMLIARCGGAIDSGPPIADAAIVEMDDAELPAFNLDSGIATLDATTVSLPAPDGGFDPPPAKCLVGDASDAATCPTPPSVCANADWLVYYDHGHCANGLCVWTKTFHGCACANGSCMSHTTAPTPW